MLHFLAQTTQPTHSLVSDTAVLIGAITALVLALGGGAGIVTLLNALKSFRQQTNTALNQLAAAGQQTRDKVNEVAEKNPADVKPLPPMPPLTVPATEVPVVAVNPVLPLTPKAPTDQPLKVQT